MKLILKIVICLCLMTVSADARMGVVGMGAGTAITASCSTAAESHTDATANSPSMGMTSGYEIVAFAFTGGTSGDLCKIDLYLKKVGSPTFNIKARVYNNNSGSPGTQNGADSNAIASNTLSTSEGVITFAFSSTKPSITSSTAYFIAVVSVSPPNNWSDYVGGATTGADGFCSVVSTCVQASADGASWANYEDRPVKMIGYR